MTAPPVPAGVAPVPYTEPTGAQVRNWRTSLVVAVGFILVLSFFISLTTGNLTAILLGVLISLGLYIYYQVIQRRGQLFDILSRNIQRRDQQFDILNRKLEALNPGGHQSGDVVEGRSEAQPINYSPDPRARPCPFCGIWNVREYSFCQKCGKPLPPPV